MAGTREQGKPRFLWQAVLILLPVAVLSALGWLSVSQDKILARHDATERARSIAEELAGKIWTELTAAGSNAASGPHYFQVDDAGRLIFPPAYAQVPVPEPFDLSELNPG